MWTQTYLRLCVAHLQLHGSINLHEHPQSFPADQIPQDVVKSITNRQGMFASFSVTPRGFEPAPQRQSCLPCWSQLPFLAAQTRANSRLPIRSPQKEEMRWYTAKV